MHVPFSHPLLKIVEMECICGIYSVVVNMKFNMVTKDGNVSMKVVMLSFFICQDSLHLTWQQNFVERVYLSGLYIGWGIGWKEVHTVTSKLFSTRVTMRGSVYD